MRFAGERMRRITIQQPGQTRDPDTGQNIDTWTNIDNDPTPFAHVRDKRGGEDFAADKKTADVVRTFQIWERDDLDEVMTIVDQGRRYDIRRIFEIGASKLDIEAEWTQGKYDS